jgi:hypothetical protein
MKKTKFLNDFIPLSISNKKVANFVKMSDFRLTK